MVRFHAWDRCSGFPGGGGAEKWFVIYARVMDFGENNMMIIERIGRTDYSDGLRASSFLCELKGQLYLIKIGFTKRSY